MSVCKVLFFATIKDLSGIRQTVLELPDGITVRGFKAILCDQFPSLVPILPTALVAVNREYTLDDQPIPPEAEIALFPPVSGGSFTIPGKSMTTYPTYCVITEESIDLNIITAQITAPTTGAVVIFTGIVRAVTTRGDAFETSYLEYEAYVPMAEAKMRQIVEEIRSRWPNVEGIVIIQRIGRLEPGTPTTVVACAAAHRNSGVFEAARYGIERLKEIVPVWKKEVGPQGQEWVEGEHLPPIIPRG
jgi:molybdopterin synthase catalytic subunit